MKLSDMNWLSPELVTDFELYMSISHEGEDRTDLDLVAEANEYLSETYHQEGWPTEAVDGKFEFNTEVVVDEDQMNQFAIALAGAYKVMSVLNDFFGSKH